MMMTVWWRSVVVGEGTKRRAVWGAKRPFCTAD
jgi:hypothetical protein